MSFSIVHLIDWPGWMLRFSLEKLRRSPIGSARSRALPVVPSWR